MKRVAQFSAFLCALWMSGMMVGCNQAQSSSNKITTTQKGIKKDCTKVVVKALDTADYDRRMLALSNNDTKKKWPAKAAYPLPGGLLPYHRIVAFYGNLFSKRMGILGELPKKDMLKKLNDEVTAWQAADSSVKVIPALHYIAITAQSKPGKNSMYRYRMPFHQIDTIISWANSIHAVVFLDVQVGHSSVKDEVATLERYLKLPNVHLGIDPEFSMKTGAVPCTKIGTFDASDVNDAVAILSRIVKENHLPPKVLVVHRFTQGMVTNYKNITTVPEVQIVMNMDGFGSKVLKKDSYRAYIYREPVQFTGFKLFYKNDTKKGRELYTPEEILEFKPKPSYIQYQ